MNRTVEINETILKHIPPFLVLIIILLLGMPYIGLYLGFDFGLIAKRLNLVTAVQSHLIELEIRGYFRQTLLQWSGFSIATVTILLSFTQYRLTNDKIALIIGMSVLLSGSIEAIHTVFIDGMSLSYHEKSNLDALIWTFSNSLGGFILAVGGSILLINKENQLSVTAFILLAIFLILTAITVIFYSAEVIKIPEMWFRNNLLSRPYELIPIGIYLFIMVWIYPLIYKRYPTILADCIFYMATTQIVISIYLMLLSNNQYDEAYNIAYFLKIITYFIPASCLIINYVSSYSMVLKAQERLKKKQESLKHIASHDSLTNLFNRREFEHLLDNAIHSAKLNPNKISMALLLIDLDNFKSINDTYGHIHGDKLLKQFADRLAVITRENDILSRVGGDEFTLILYDIKSHFTVREISRRILSEVNSAYNILDKLITVTVSIGIAIYPNDGKTTNELLRKADLALYKAKNSGKNSYQFYTQQLNLFQHRTAEIEAHLRKALINDELKLFYQPKFNLITQKIVGAEVLLRWKNHALGKINPDEFIPIAEKTGLIIDMGHWVLRKTCEQVMEWKNKYNVMLSFSINISPLQLTNNYFFPYLKKILNEFNYPPQHLEFEITESLLINESKEVRQLLTNITSLGIKLSLDDFGKEYSSLNRLRTLPIDSLKIDKSFISDIKSETEKVIIIDMIITLARELGMSIIAEGIETEEQLNYLISRKCYIGQGFLFSKPISAKKFAKLIKDQNSPLPLPDCTKSSE